MPQQVQPQQVYIPAGPRTPGFFSSLFDLSFTNFITTKLVKLLFIIAIIIAVLEGLGILVYGLNMPSPLPVVGIIAAPVVFFLIILGARVQLEILIVLFRMSEHLAEIAEQGRQR